MPPFPQPLRHHQPQRVGLPPTGIAPTRSKPTAHRWTSVPSIRTCGVSQVQEPRSLEALEAVTDGPIARALQLHGRGIDLPGYHVFPGRRQLRNDNGHRFARKLRGFAEGHAAGVAGLGGFQPRRAKLDRPRTARGDGGLAAGDFWGYYFLQGEQTRGRAGPFTVVRGTTNRRGCVWRTATTSDFGLPGIINPLPSFLYPADAEH